MSFSFNFFPTTQAPAPPSATPPAPDGGDGAAEPACRPLLVVPPPSRVAGSEAAGFVAERVDIDVPLMRAVPLAADGLTGVQRDVVAGVYEGGAKVWECTLDLLRYMVSHPALIPVGGVMCDLGCGAGLLGCLALRLGAGGAVFQDFNESVVAGVTAPTLALNGIHHDATGRVTLCHGSWQSWASMLEGGGATPVGVGSVTTLLASETLYCVDAYPALLALCYLLLCGDAAGVAGDAGGNALFASKRFYYGVGGSVAAFIRAAHGFVPTPAMVAARRANARGSGGRAGDAEMQPMGLSAAVVGTVEDGATMIRDIVRVALRWPEPPAASA